MQRYPSSRPSPRLSPWLYWGLFTVYILLVTADVATTLRGFALVAPAHLPVWRWEWNPFMASFLRSFGLGSAIVWEVATVPIIGLVFFLARRDRLIRGAVFAALIVGCLVRIGVVSHNVSALALAAAPSTRPVATATLAPTATLVPTATAPVPTATPTAQPTPRPTRTPRPTATPCKHNCG